jgi:hypothetical protein
MANSAFRLNLGGEGEEAGAINQQPPWRAESKAAISRNGQPLLSIATQGEPLLFCDNIQLPFPDDIIDEVLTNSVPLDHDVLGRPGVQTSEIKRVLRKGGTWVHDGIPRFTKP